MRNYRQISAARSSARSRLALVALILAALAYVMSLLAIDAADAEAGTLRVQLGMTQAGCLAQNWFASGMTGTAYCAKPPQLPLHVGWDIWPGRPSISAGTAGQWQINAPAGITIDTVSVPSIQSSALASGGGYGWRAGDYWAGGQTTWGPQTTQASEGQLWPLNSSYYGFKLYCYASSCNNQAYLKVTEVDLTASENQGPYLIAMGSNNLWYQAAHWVWNPPGDPWSIAFAGTDASGVCNMYAFVNNLYLQGPTASPSGDTWHQCPDESWSSGASVDTRDYVGTSGPLTLVFGATNAAGVLNAPTQNLQVDNDPVTVSLSTPNDSNPSVWVNHPVTLAATANAGPSGVSGMNCSVDGAPAYTYPADGLSVDGDGAHIVTCTAWNGAVDPQGQPNTGTSSMTVHIDEAPPTMTFEPQNPAAPAHLVVDASDAESGVASGSIQMAPAGTSNWTSLPTTFDGQHLITDINDAGRSGAYTFRATSCDNVGNCASTDESLRLPLRVAASSDVSFTQIQAPAVVVARRVLVGWRHRRVRRHGRLISVKTGGHYVTVQIVIRKNSACATRRIHVGRNRWREVTACRKVRIKTLSSQRVGFGKRVTIGGVLLTADGVAVSGAPIQIMAAPDNGLNRFSRITTVRTSANGRWSATLPPGPSEIIRAQYAGSSTLLPATGTARTIVPARVRLISVSPRHIPWGGTVRIVGQLEGGHLPPGGALVRLRIGVGSAFTTYGVKEHVTGNGRFSTTYTFGLGEPSIHQSYWFEVASLPMGNYPFAPSDSRRVSVIVGGA